MIQMQPMPSIVGPLLLILMSVGFDAIAAIDRSSDFQSCTKRSLQLSTPQLRDLERLDCLERKWPKARSLKQCLEEARKFEYLTNEQLALKSCYYTNTRYAGIKNCLFVADQLHEVAERDEMRYDCVSVAGLPKNKSQCLNISKEFEQIKYRKKLNGSCLEN